MTNGKGCEQVKDIEGFVKEEVTDIRNKVMEENTREADKISATLSFCCEHLGFFGIPGLSGINGPPGPNTTAELAARSLTYDVVHALMRIS